MYKLKYWWILPHLVTFRFEITKRENIFLPIGDVVLAEFNTFPSSIWAGFGTKASRRLLECNKAEIVRYWDSKAEQLRSSLKICKIWNLLKKKKNSGMFNEISYMSTKQSIYYFYLENFSCTFIYKNDHCYFQSKLKSTRAFCIYFQKNIFVWFHC